MLYLIKIVNTNYVKIGYTENPFGRVSGYRNHLPSELIEFFIIKDGTREDENYYREKYRIFKTKSGFEWLKVPDEILKDILLNFKDGESLSLYKRGREEWYDENKDELVRLFLENTPISQMQSMMNVPINWIEYGVSKYNNQINPKVWYKKKRFKTKSKVSLPELIQDIDNHTDSKYYNIIKRCIANIGIENTKSLSIKQIKKYASNGLTFEQIKCSLGYKNNQFVSCKQIKSDLKELDIRGKITEFYYCKPAIKKIKGKIVRGYVF